MQRNPDMKPMDFSGVQILEIPDSHVMSDSKGRQVIAYAMQDNPHAKGLLLVYVPDANANGPVTFTFQVQDDNATNGTTGQDTDQSPNTLTLDTYTVGSIRSVAPPTTMRVPPTFTASARAASRSASETCAAACTTAVQPSSARSTE